MPKVYMMDRKKNEKMKKARNILIWLLICDLALIASTFIHECAHGFSCWLSGYAVSTGFNRVGNAYKFPSDLDFRAGFIGGEVLKDLGPAITLTLAAIFTIIFIRRKYNDSVLDKSVLALALSNSIIRLVPAATVLLRIIITGSGLEDEIQQGAAFAELLGWPFMTYALAVLSIVISAVCLFFIYKRFSEYKKQGQTIPNPSWIWLAYVISFVVLNILDHYFRINWVP